MVKEQPNRGEQHASAQDHSGEWYYLTSKRKINIDTDFGKLLNVIDGTSLGNEMTLSELAERTGLSEERLKILIPFTSGQIKRDGFNIEKTSSGFYLKKPAKEPLPDLGEDEDSDKYKSKLEAFGMYFSGQPLEEVIDKVRPGSPEGSEDEQAQTFNALCSVADLLSKRDQEGNLTEKERAVYDLIPPAMRNTGDLIANFEEQFGMTYTPEKEETTPEKVTGEAAKGISTPKAEAIQEAEKKLRPIDQPEFGTLSRVDVASLAGAILTHRQLLGTILEQKGLALAEESVLNEVIGLIGNEPLIETKETEPAERTAIVETQESDPARHAAKVIQMRIDVLDKIKAIMKNPQAFDQIIEEATEQNTNVGLLLLHLSEIESVQGSLSGKKEQIDGIDFLKTLITDKEARKTGLILKSKEEENPVRVFEQTDSGGINRTVVEPIVPDKRLTVGEEEEDAGKKITDLVEGVKVEIVRDEGVAPGRETDASVQETPKRIREIESRDPEVRERINKYLDIIFSISKTELPLPASPGQVTRKIKRLKQILVESLIDEGLVPTLPGRKADQYQLDATGIATALYLSYPKQKNTLDSKKLQREIQNIVREELKKREEKERKDSI